MSAELVLVNGTILTMGKSNRIARAVAVKKGKILGVGTNAEVKRWIGRRTKTIDLKNKTVLPGFIDSHAHMVSLGRPLPWVDLRHVSSIKEIQRLLKAEVRNTSNGKWILGRGWDQERLREKRFPTRWDLDIVSVDNPILIIRACGHAAVANTKVLRIAKMDKKSPAVLREFVDTNAAGEPTGLVTEKAVDLLSSLPQPSEENLLGACCRACSEAAKYGLTSIACIASDPREVQALQKLRKEGRLSVRVYVMVPVECFDDFRDKRIDDPFLKLRCLKIFADGSLGARTAALQEPYKDEPSKSGMLYYSRAQLRNLVKKAEESGFQVAVHAIGDRAVKETLSAFGSVLSKEQIAEHRHRIEHASLLSPDLIRLIRALGVLVCVQPCFVVSDFWVSRRLGPERARWVYAFKSLMKSGVLLASSSDAPIELVSPLLGVWAAVAKHRLREERLSVEEALRTYTINAAYFSFEEAVKGSIEVGKYADLTILSHNPLKVEPSKLKDIQVEMTIVDGKIVYSSESLSSRDHDRRVSQAK
jgi:predicted amidohydrolase YtcJ